MDTAITQVTKVKNPKRVEGGKKAHEKYLLKMKEALLNTSTTLNTTDTTLNTTDTTLNTTDTTPWIIGVILVVGGVAAYFYHQKTSEQNVKPQQNAKPQQQIPAKHDDDLFKMN
jgi:hypothetical protein